MSSQGATHDPKVLERMLHRRPLTAPRAAVVIGVYITVITVVGATVARLVDRHDFHSFNAAIWWALQTVTTVGYGDITPKSTLGRSVAGLLMVSGIAFLAVITASVTAALLGTTRVARDSRTEVTPARTTDTATWLASIEARLTKLEARPPEGPQHQPPVPRDTVDRDKPTLS